MGRQEQPLDPGHGPLARFACDLRDLRRRAGSPPYRELATRTHYSASTLAAATAGHRLPGAAVLAAFVGACGGDPDAWEQRRVRTHILMTGPQPPSPARPPAEVLPSASEPPPPRPSPTSRGPARRWWATGLSAVMAAVSTVTVAAFATLVPGDSAAPDSGARTDRSRDAAMSVTSARLPDDAGWLRADGDIPRDYRVLIVRAGTLCHVPQVTPALIAAMLEAESGFDPALSDPQKDEYGIARWTPRVLRYYLPPERQSTVPVPPFTPEDSIAAMGRMLCAIAPELEGVPGDPAVNLAAAYRTATWIVQRQDAVLRDIQPYLDRVRANLERYRPASNPS
ncbi:helix-turn-helix domain-containing protein [Streptomyces sp. NPDC054961]